MAGLEEFIRAAHEARELAGEAQIALERALAGLPDEIDAAALGSLTTQELENARAASAFAQAALKGAAEVAEEGRRQFQLVGRVLETR
jgi:hypothetical protein